MRIKYSVKTLDEIIRYWIEEFANAIGEIWKAEKQYNPEFIGYAWDDSNPRIQLEPIGSRGYIEMVPVKKI